MKGASLTEKNLIYMSGMLMAESQFSIKFIQTEAGALNLAGRITVHADMDSSISIKWLDNTSVPEVSKPADQNHPIADILFYLLIGRDSNGDFTLLINGVKHFIKKGGNFNFLRIEGLIEPIDLPIMILDQAKNYKNFASFDNMIRDDIIAKNAKINLLLTPIKPSESEKNKIDMILDCWCAKSYNCEEDDDDNSVPPESEPTSLYPLSLTMDLKEKTITAKTFKKSEKDEFCEMDEKRDQPFSMNYTFVQPMWLSIKHDPHVPEYKLLINNKNVFSIKSGYDIQLLMEIGKISLNGFFVLFNKIMSFPMGFALKDVKEDKLPENLHITVKGMVMANAEMLQFMLATPNYISKTDITRKALNIYHLANGEINQKYGIVHLHVRVKQNENELCIGNHNPTGPCTGNLKPSPFVDGKPFLFEIIGKEGNAAYSVRINGKQFGGEYKNLDAMFLAITGDMVLFDSPKCEPECPGQQKKM